MQHLLVIMAGFLKMKKQYSSEQSPERDILRESEDKYRLLFENVNDGIYQSTFDGEIITANPALVKMLGYDSVEQLKSKNIAQDFYPDVSERAGFLNVLLEKGVLEDTELVLKKKDGTLITVIEHSREVKDSNGNSLYFEGTLTDITERKKTEKALRESEKKYQTLIETSQDGLSVFDPKGKMIYFNKRKKEMMGYESDEEFMSLNILNMVHPDDRPVLKSKYDEILVKERISNFQMRILRKDGTFFWAEFNAALIMNSEDEQPFIMATMRDITERMKIQEDLLMFKRSIDIQIDGAYWMDRESKFVYVNEAACKSSGYSSVELIGKKVSLIDKNATPENLMLIWKYLEKEGFLKGESIHMRKDGSTYPVEIVSTLVRFGGREYNCGFARDITERKKNAEEMRLRLEQLRQIIDLVPSYIFAKDIDGKFLLVNKAMAEVFGMDPDSVVGKDDFDTGASEQIVKGYRDADLFVIEKGQPVMIPEEHVLRADGQLGWFQTVKIPYRHPGLEKPAVLGVATEITERKKVEDELRKSEERFRKLFESHSAVKLLVDPKSGRIIDANKAAVDYYGWDIDTLRNMTVYDLSEVSFDKIKKRMDEVQQEKGIVFESVHRLANGTLRDVELYASRIEIEKNTILHSIVHDITDKKKILTDLIIAKEKSEESDRLKTAFLHNISHEIRTPMNAIVGFTSLMDSPNLSEETRKQYIDIIYQSSSQLLSIITDIVDISNIETGHSNVKFTDININFVLKNIYEQFSYRAKSAGIGFRYCFGMNDDVSMISCDETKLIQVISNLLNNAFKFTKQGYIEFGYSLLNRTLEFYVRDTGIGISGEYFERIFDRFYQIENPSGRNGGTGLGLSICKAYIEQMGGRIWLESDSGKGTTFYFSLPFMQYHVDEAHKSDDYESETNSVTSESSILIAEDDDINYLLLKEILEGMGLKTIRACNGVEAVDKCIQLRDTDLVLMDIKMPLMDGYSATAKIKLMRPLINIIAITAYTQNTDREKILMSGFSDYISKPVDKNKLVKLLRKYLEAVK